VGYRGQFFKGGKAPTLHLGTNFALRRQLCAQTPTLSLGANFAPRCQLWAKVPTANFAPRCQFCIYVSILYLGANRARHKCKLGTNFFRRRELFSRRKTGPWQKSLSSYETRFKNQLFKATDARQQTKSICQCSAHRIKKKSPLATTSL
jgi:hypothetical protein